MNLTLDLRFTLMHLVAVPTQIPFFSLLFFCSHQKAKMDNASTLIFITSSGAAP